MAAFLLGALYVILVLLGARLLIYILDEGWR